MQPVGDIGRELAARLFMDKQLAGQARNLKPELHWWDDTPDKLLAEIQRVEVAKQAKADTAKQAKTDTVKQARRE